MTATDELRRLLDECGVEYEVDDAKTVRVTRWGAYGDWVSFIEYDNGDTKFCIDARRLTPEQAVEATLGRGNAGRYVGLRQGKYWERIENSDYYCGGCGWKVTDHDSYCPECGGALHKAALDSSNCTNSERTGTCHAEETERFECLDSRYKSFDYNPYITVHVMECSECGRTYEHVNGGYEFCPRCGRKVVTNG